MDNVDIVIVGGGVIGLAIAVQVSTVYPDYTVVLCEKHRTFGQETSDRNSEVIHGGMYYPSGTLKAKLCVKGNPMLYAYCKAHHVAHQRIGKLIITRNKAEEEAVRGIYEQGQKNGVPGLRYLTEAQVHDLEPNIEATGGLLSETTGIISAYELMKALAAQAEENGVLLAYHHKVDQVAKVPEGYVVSYTNDEGSDKLGCRVLFNCAGLYSDEIPAQLGIDVDKEGYRIYPVKGEYFSLCTAKSRLMTRLIYPPPMKDLKGLGIHVTKSLEGMVKFGPSAFNVTDKADYSVNPDHLEQFYQAAHAFLPFVEREDLSPDMSGIRPKIQGPGMPWQDYIIRNEAERGLPNLIDLVGIESPGLTSCLAIAEFAVALMK